MKKSFWSKPITWGGFAKLYIVATIIGIILAGIEYIYLFTNTPSRIVDWFKEKFRKIRKETDYEDVE